MIIQGDARNLPLKYESIDMCMTSPPYWGLRDYGLGKDQLGLEPTPELYIEHMTEIFNEVKRALKKGGTLWLNIGDTYASGGGQTTGQSFLRETGRTQNHPNYSPKAKLRKTMPKCLLMIPERLAWSLIQNGWTLRNKIIWYKPNAMPSSVRDRFSNRWEYIFMFSKSKKYYFDLDAIREPHKTTDGIRGDGSPEYRADHFEHNPIGKNPGDVFEINTRPFPEAHFAVFPPKLCEKPIKAGCPEGGIVLDPFCGAGTTCLVAKNLRRKYIGVDIKQEYCQMAEKRLSQGVL